MNDVGSEQDEEHTLSSDISDEALEVAALAGNAGVYTQLGLCTLSLAC
jgi:hypothetical protein